MAKHKMYLLVLGVWKMSKKKNENKKQKICIKDEKKINF